MASPRDPSDHPPTGTVRRRPLLRWLGGSTLVLVVAVAAVLYWRQPLAGAALRAWLDRSGLPGAALSVEALSLSRLRVVDIRLGAEADIGAAELVFDLSRLPGQPVTRVTIERARLDLTDPYGPLRRRLGTPRAPAGPATTLRQALDRMAVLPAIAVRDVTLTVAVDDRPVTVTGGIEADRSGAGLFAGRLELRLSGEVGGEARALTIGGTARLGRPVSAIEATLTTADGTATGELSARAEITSETEARISADGHLDTTDPGRLSALVPALAGTAGTLRLAAGTTAPFVVPLAISLGRAGLADAWRRATAGGVTVEATIADGRHPAGLSGVHGTLSAVAQTAGQSSRRPRLVGRLSLRADRIATGGAVVAGATLDGPFRIDQRDDSVIVVLPQPLRLGAAEIVTGDDMVVVEPLTALLTGGRTHALRAGLGVSAQQADLRLKLEFAATRLWSGAGVGHKFHIAPATLRLAGAGDIDGAMRLHLRIPSLSVAEAGRKATLDDLALSLRKAGNSVTGNVGGRLSLLDAGKPVIAPVTIRSELALWRDILTFDASAEMAAGAVSATAKGRHDLVAGRGAADLSLTPIRFVADSVVLRTLAPTLSGAEVRAGSVEASAHLPWGPDAPQGTASFRVDGMDIVSGGVTVEGLTVAVRFDRTAPLRTPPGQTLRVRRIAAGAAIDDLTMQFSLVDGASAGDLAVKIESLTARVAGGRLLVSPTVIGSGAADSRVRIEVRDVDLAVLLDLFGLDGVSGTGRLSGVIPVRQAGGSVAIEDGRLAAAGPGVLRIRSEAAKRALAQGGADVALMLSALEDFRYESLTLEIEKAAGGDGRILVRTRGRNPTVGDGQPFIINLNVSGNVDRLAAIAARLLELPASVVRSMVQGTP